MPPLAPSRRRPGRRRAVLCAAALALAGTAACSTIDVATSPVSTPTGADKQLVQQATTPYPDSYRGPTAPVSAPRDTKITVITCSSILSGCVSPANGVRTAAKALGWKVSVLDGGGSADKQNAQILNAISNHSAAIVTTAIDPNTIQSGLHAARRAGVPVVAGSNGLDSPNAKVTPSRGNIGYSFDVAPDYAALGRKTAQWIRGDSAGKAHIAVYSDKTFPSVLALQKGLLSGLHKCRGCKVSPLQYFTGDQTSQILPRSVVSYLRSHPDTDYVFMPYDPAAAAVVPAISQAGLGGRVKVVGVLGSQENLNFIRQGRVQVADAAYDNRYMGYAVVDQLSRLLAKQKLSSPTGEQLPFVVLDRHNLPAPGSDWTAGYPYRGAFERNWHG